MQKYYQILSLFAFITNC